MEQVAMFIYRSATGPFYVVLEIFETGLCFPVRKCSALADAIAALHETGLKLNNNHVFTSIDKSLTLRISRFDPHPADDEETHLLRGKIDDGVHVELVTYNSKCYYDHASRRFLPLDQPINTVCPRAETLSSYLPRHIPLGMSAPERRSFSQQHFSPATVYTTSDLPPYLILGELDPDSFNLDDSGWRARWRGSEDNTYLDVAFKAAVSRYEIGQSWLGISGSISFVPANVPLADAILRTLYVEFPEAWDTHARKYLETSYQLSYAGNKRGMYTASYFPDGAFRVIAIPVATRELRTFYGWLRELPACHRLPFPVSAHARLLSQTVKHMEREDPDWTFDPVEVFNRSFHDTGLFPLGMPFRQVDASGSAAWLLQRQLYVVYLSVPFAGLASLLSLLHKDYGAIRLRDDLDLGFDLQPVIFPQEYIAQVESIAFWDKSGTVKNSLQLKSSDVADEQDDADACNRDRDESSRLISAVEMVSCDMLSET
jgi:hypothetical protein